MAEEKLKLFRIRENRYGQAQTEPSPDAYVAAETASEAMRIFAQRFGQLAATIYVEPQTIEFLTATQH